MSILAFFHRVFGMTLPVESPLPQPACKTRRKRKKRTAKKPSVSSVSSVVNKKK